ncbi:MAG: 2OG-Fe(II) oxygenase [Acidobacteriota bacterium]
MSTVHRVINPQVLADKERLATAFRSARFFRHVVIDDFLAGDVCRGLVDEFPAFQEANALNELGKVGQKAYRQDVDKIGGNYARLDRCLQSRGFLDLMSELTGIGELLYDPDYAGGGTHENIDGAELDVHVDFNFHPNMTWHRRLNLIVFLNPEWEASWGGCFEVHRDPWSPGENEFERVVPRLNRAVIFETTEVSWHGFDQITLPADKRDLSRKSFALYLYTNERPAEEIAPAHATVYVPRPLPERFTDGTLLQPEDTRTLHTAIARRDQQIAFLYQREKELSARITKLTSLVHERLPLRGYVRQAGAATGLWEDLWAGEEVSLRFISQRPVERIVVEGFVPELLPAGRPLVAEVGDARFTTELGHGAFGWRLDVSLEADREQGLRLLCPETWNPHRAEVSGDARDLAFVLTALTFY